MTTDRTKNYKNQKHQKELSKVFVVYGRNIVAKQALFDFLRSIEIKPLEWSEVIALTGETSPFIGDLLDNAFMNAQAVIVLLTGDDLARLGTRFTMTEEQKEKLAPQPRPNVLFEAGMAFGRHPRRTILVQLGKVRNFTDIAGRHVIHLDNTPEKRQELVSRLKIAGCNVDITHKRDWLTTGDFENCISSPDIELENGSTTEQRLFELEEIETKILQELAKAEDKGNVKIPEGDFVRLLNISRIRIKHHLKVLVDQEFVHEYLAIDDPPIFKLDIKGREYLVKHDLI